MKEKYFYLDCMEGYFKGYTFECYWNGWSCPMFERKIVIEILEKMKEFDNLEYHFINDTLIYKLENDDFEETLTPNEQGLYSLGAWSWCWSEISEDELKEQIWQSYKDDIVQF